MVCHKFLSEGKAGVRSNKFIFLVLLPTISGQTAFAIAVYLHVPKSLNPKLNSLNPDP